MTDKRTCLGKGTVLQLDKEYIIQGEAGRGASCLVYDGYYMDSGKHRVIIKECFPYHIEAERDSEGAVIPAEGWEGRFENAKEVFWDAYRRNNELRDKAGLTNATIDSRWMHKKNNTLYFVMGYIEGRNYGEFTESCLKDIFTRMKSLCKFAGGCHQNGCLLLDIKPENILIPSDTKEQVVLFDFDSLVEIEDLREGSGIRISCSDGFSAPELVQGDLGKIGVTADIYSVGAVVFYKIFGRKPGIWDQTWNAAYDFSAMAFLDSRYQPKLFPKLTEFFHKTLAAAVLRYQDMEEVTAALEGLEQRADVEGVMLLNNFTYSFSQFIGRKKELAEIREILKEQDTVFLFGMGGIGKTELAKKFASQYRSQFNRIVFLRFAGTVMETICSDELMIAGCDPEEQEPVSDFYNRKLACLRQNAGKDDLIILDNFDQRSSSHDIGKDAHLNDLLNCGCKVLATTREAIWEEFAYTQVEIKPFEDAQECRALFQKNNSKEYSQEEWESVYQLFHLFERHTMTVAMLAKYLLHTGQMPSELLRQMAQKEGVVSAAMLPVRQRKDEIREERLVYAHLLVLFDLSGFTGMEMEIMRSLSLLGPIRIKKSIFVQYFRPGSGVEGHLGNLARHGWVEEDVKTDKISLHQIILDLAYHFLNPTSENCPNLTRSMAAYFRKGENSRIRRESQRKLAEYLIDRMSGADFPLAELYYAYCQYIKEDDQVLKEAKEICEGVDSLESDILMVRIYHIGIRSFIRKTEWLELEEEEQMDQAFIEIYGRVFQLEMDIFARLRKAVLRNAAVSPNRGRVILPKMDGLEQEGASGIQGIKDRIKEIEEVMRINFESYMEGGHSLAPYVNDALVRLFLETAEVVETLGNRICEECMLINEPAFSGIISIFRDAEQIYLYTCKLAEQESISYKVKEDVFKKVIDFYMEDDFSCLYRCTYLGDQSKSAYYSEKLHEVRAVLTEGKEIFNSSETSYMDAAHQAQWNKRYEDAIDLYQKALERDEWLAEEIQYSMSEAYIGLREYGKAETLLLEVLAVEEAKGDNVCSTLEKMVEIYELQGDGEKVSAYCGRIIQSQARLAEEGDINAVAKALVFGIKKAKWEGGGELHPQETEYLAWNRYFQILDTCQEPDAILVSAYCEYAGYCWEIHQPEQALKLLFSAAENYNKEIEQDAASELYKCIIKDQRFQEIRKDLYIRAVLGEARILLEDRGDGEWALSLCNYAKGLLEEGAPDLEYLEALLHHIEADIYLHSEKYHDYGKYIKKARQCNYYLLTERKLEERLNLKTPFKEWEEAVRYYGSLDCYDLAKQCLKRMEIEAEKEGSMSCFLEYYSACFAWIQTDDAGEELPVYTRALYHRLSQSIRCDTKKVDNELCLQALGMVRDNAFKYGAYGAALYAGMLSVPILLDGRPSCRMEVAEELPEEWMPQEGYVARAEAIFPQKAEEEKLDGLIRLMDDMMAGIEGHAGLEDLYAALSRIEQGYRGEQIDFKR